MTSMNDDMYNEFDYELNTGRKKSPAPWFVLGGIALIAILLFVGYRISRKPFGAAGVPSNQPQPTYPAASSVPTPTSQFVVQEPTSISPQSLPDTNPPLSLPFQDNFSGGLSLQWRILSGKAAIVNGMLQAVGDDVTLEIGNSALSSYTAEFDCCGKSGKVTVTIGQKLRFWFDDCGTACGYGGWEGFDSGKWNQISRFNIGDTPGRFKLAVIGNSCQLFAKGELVSEISYGSSLSGPFSIRLEKVIGWSSAIGSVTIK
jgi:hypothetical protein